MLAGSIIKIQMVETIITTTHYSMNRTQIIYALAAHIRSTSPISFHEIMKWKTEHLQALLEWYEGMEEDEKFFKKMLDMVMDEVKMQSPRPLIININLK